MSCISQESIKWNINQIKGDSFGDAKDADVFTCIEFNDNGDYLAAGDKSGHIYVFNSTEEKNFPYNIYCAFTSHEPEFDYLKSFEIEEKINAICWLPSSNNALHLLSTNDKVIKLWRMSVQSPEVYNFNLKNNEDSDPDSASETTCNNGNLEKNVIRHVASTSNLRVPRYRKSDRLTIEVRPRKVFANAHTYHINAISANSDQETYLSADDLRINLWHLDITNQSFTIVDLKPPNMEELSEVITCARFHPNLCNMLGYSTSRGIVRLCDMRQGALCDNHVLALNDHTFGQHRGFFADIISSLSDFRFDHADNYILARDYLNLKVWDVRKGDKPCEVYSVHEPLRSQLCMLYETDGIFDKFLCSWSENDRYVLTGSYGNVLRIFDRLNKDAWLYDLGEPDMYPTLSNTGSSHSLRPQKTRLHPKRFLSADSDIGTRLGITSVCLAYASAVDAATSSTQSNETSCDNLKSQFSPCKLTETPTAGSKRRKQTIPSKSNVTHLDSEPLDVHEYPNNVNSTSNSILAQENSWVVTDAEDDDLDSEDNEINEDGEDDDEIDEEEDVFRKLDPNGPHFLPNRHVESNIDDHNQGLDHSLPLDECSGGLTLTGLRQLDFQRKFLHVAWHPHRNMIVSACGNQLFLCNGKQSYSPLNNISPQNVLQDTENTLIGSPLDIKAAKRRRRRKGAGDSHNNKIDADPVYISPTVLSSQSLQVKCNEDSLNSKHLDNDSHHSSLTIGEFHLEQMNINFSSQLLNSNPILVSPSLEVPNQSSMELE